MPEFASAILAGYMISTAYTFVNVFQYKPGDIHFCTADVGSLVIATSFMVLCVQALLVDENGKEVAEHEDGVRKVNLCVKAPWPSIIRTRYCNP